VTIVVVAGTSGPASGTPFDVVGPRDVVQPAIEMAKEATTTRM
jgi:hypothetical protein